MERDLSLYPSTDAGTGCKNLASGGIFDEYLTGALNLNRKMLTLAIPNFPGSAFLVPNPAYFRERGVFLRVRFA
jgi:hypothetical protein